MRTVHRTLLALALAFAIAVAPSVALAAPASASAVSGRIFAADLRTPAAGLSVQALPDGAREPVARATTDIQGRFALQGLPAGRYLLVLYDAQGTPLAAAPLVADKAAMTVALALPAPDALAPAQTAEGETKKDDEKKDEEAAATTKSGFSAWVSSPTGATVVLLASAVVVAVAADQLTNDDTDTNEITASPSEP
jgi:hypothetical protein